MRPARLELATSWFVAGTNGVSRSWLAFAMPDPSSRSVESERFHFRYVPDLATVCRTLLPRKGKKRATFIADITPHIVLRKCASMFATSPRAAKCS